MENKENRSRRSFIKTTVSGAVAATVAPSLVKGEVLSPELIQQTSKGANAS